MQVLCGQCGRTSKVEGSPRQDSVACPCCGHEIHLTPAGGAEEPTNPPAPPADDEGFAAQVQREITRKIVITCGACGKHLKASRRMIGQKVRCRACGRKIRVPVPDELLPDGEPVRPGGLAAGEVDLHEQSEWEDLPTAKLIRAGPPMWVWILAAAILAAGLGTLIWALVN